MTIASETNRNDYTGNGATSVYSYNFKIFDDADLLVTERDTSDVETTYVLDTDYTVSGAGDTAGGSITLTAGNLTSGYALTIRRVVDLTQETDIRNQGEFYPEGHEDEFDLLVMADQQQQNDLNRSVKMAETEVLADVDATLPVAAALKFWRWNAAGTGLENIDAGDLSGAITTVSSGLSLSSSNLSIVNPNRLVVAGGTVDVITGSTTPAPASLTNNLAVLVEASGANTVTTPTFNLDSLGAKTIVKDNDVALAVGDIPGANFRMSLVFDSSLDKWVLLNPTDYLSLTSGGTVTGAVSLSSTLGVTGISTLTGGLKTEGTPVVKFKILDIGDWDMDATASIDVAHGLADPDKILFVCGFIRNDTASTYYPLTLNINSSIVTDVQILSFDLLNISLARLTAGFFDGTDFDSTSYNRGRLIIWHTDTAIS